jgi:hypothetical protein
MLGLLTIILICVATLAFGLFFLGVFLYRAAEKKQQVTFVREGEAEFKVSGNNLIEIFLNLDGWCLTKDGRLKPVPGRNAQYGIEAAKPEEVIKKRGPAGLIRERWGLYWVSILYPWRRIYKFNITKYRLRSKIDIAEDAGLKNRVTHEIEEVNSLRIFFSIPFFFGGIETRDGFKVDLVLTGLCLVAIPYIPVMQLGGKYTPVIEAAINTALIDLLNKINYTDLIKLPKGKGSKFWNQLTNINKKPKKADQKSLVDSTGIMLLELYMEDMQLAPGQESEDEATRAIEKKRLEGEADLQMAKLEKEAMMERAIGKAAEDVELAKALKTVDPELAKLVTAQKVSENLRGLQVLGGSSLIGVTLNPTDTKI